LVSYPTAPGFPIISDGVPFGAFRMIRFGGVFPDADRS
jgi:hypothetical protein